MSETRTGAGAGKATGRSWWRSLDERADSPEFRKFVEAEFPSEAPKLLDDVSRRQFLKVMGASMALLTLAGCRWPEEEIVPYSHRPAGAVPGQAKEFASTMELGGVGFPVIARSYDGRPVKVDGNPDHPASLGASTAMVQASILELYDPDRSRGPRRAGKSASFLDFEEFARTRFAGLENGGAGFRVLSEASSSPTLAALKAQLATRFPKAVWVEYEPFSREAEREALEGIRRAHLKLDAADVIVSLDDDFLGDHPDAVALTRAFAARRRPDGKMNRLHVVESAMTVTGGMADHRYPMKPSAIAALASKLHEEITAGAATHPVAADLLAHPGTSVVTAGENASPDLHRLAFALNRALGNVGKTVEYTMLAAPSKLGSRPAHRQALADLVAEMGRGEVSTLLILGGNPVFAKPGAVGFAEALKKVGTSIHLSLYRDETSALCTWHLNRAHWLESWGDALAWDGSRCLVQPLIRPLYEGRTPIEVLATVLGLPERKGYDLVRSTWQGVLGGIGFEKPWRKALHDGFLAGSAAKPATAPGSAVVPEIAAAASDGWELVVKRDPKLSDGRFANLGWLQELPEPVTKLTWDNAALLSPTDADRMGIRSGDHIEVGVKAGDYTASVTLPAHVQPGQAAGTVIVFAGNGRPAGGRVATGSGVDVYPLLTSETPAVTVKKAGGRTELACTQDHHAIDAVGKREVDRRLHELIREATLEEYRADPEFAKHAGPHHPPLVSLFPDHEYNGRKWGMMIDLNSCTGCAACVTACQSENNVPVVGRNEVIAGRDMHWLRVDRYYGGDPVAPNVAHQPIPCMQCENAPCEQVCPVAATVHTDEGLNDMVYNRCIGTRYCSNNCPYKVRRFNWFKNHKGQTTIEKMKFNPEVTVRGRGVMEKCTYCVQRISAARITAENEGRAVKDGEAVPACAQACPANAITFGDLNDPESRVAKAAKDKRAYGLLEELNVKPRTKYMARVRNPMGKE